MARAPRIHPIGCACKLCAQPASTHPRRRAAIQAATRVAFLIVALCAIPFIIACALAGDKADRR